MSGHTPGPWRWFGNAKNNDLYLATEKRGHRYVMGFERWGMRGAQPRFQPDDHGLVSASELLTFEVGNREVRGHAQAKADDSVYRYDIKDIDCADAHLIAAAPELLDQLESAQADLDLLRRAIEEGDPKAELLIRVTDLWRRNAAAIAKATGAA